MGGECLARIQPYVAPADFQNPSLLQRIFIMPGYLDLDLDLLDLYGDAIQSETLSESSIYNIILI